MTRSSTIYKRKLTCIMNNLLFFCDFITSIHWDFSQKRVSLQCLKECNLEILLSHIPSKHIYINVCTHSIAIVIQCCLFFQLHINFWWIISTIYKYMNLLLQICMKYVLSYYSPSSSTTKINQYITISNSQFLRSYLYFS